MAKGDTGADFEGGLIQVPGADAGGSRPLLRTLVLLFAAGILIGTPAVDAVWGGRDSRVAGIDQRRAAERRRQARFADGTLASLIEDDLKDRSLVRRTLSLGYTLLLYGALGEAGGEQAIVGKDRWIFVKNRARPLEGPPMTLLKPWVNRLAALERGLRGMGVRVVFLPLPRRSAIMADYLPKGYPSRTDVDRAAATALGDAGLEAVDLYDAFAEHEGPPLFYRADAHWTEVGEMLAAEEIMRQLGLLSPESERRTRVVAAKPETQGADDKNQDLLPFIGIHKRGLASYLRGPDVPRFKFKPVKGLGQGANDPESPNPLRVALTGTSFSKRRNFVAFLRHFGQLPIDDYSRPAEGPIVPIQAFARRAQSNLPDLLLAEVPIYTAMESAGFLAEVQKLLTAFPLPENQLIGAVPLAEPRQGEMARELALTRKPTVVMRTRPGALLSTWDHVVGIRVTGEVLEGAVEIQADTRGRGASVVWKKGVNRAHLPLIADSFGSPSVKVLATAVGGRARLRVTEVQFEAPLHLDRTERLAEVDRRQLDDRWEVDFELPAGDRAAPERVLLIPSFSGEKRRPTELGVGLVAGAGEVQILTVGRVQSTGWVIASLGRAGRGEAGTLRFFGPGTEPPAGLKPCVAPVTFP